MTTVKFEGTSTKGTLYAYAYGINDPVAQLYFSNCYIGQLYTKPEHRQKGYATTLMNEAMIRMADCVSVSLYAWPHAEMDTDRIMNFYRRFKFELDPVRNPPVRPTFMVRTNFVPNPGLFERAWSFGRWLLPSKILQ